MLRAFNANLSSNPDVAWAKMQATQTVTVMDHLDAATCGNCQHEAESNCANRLPQDVQLIRSDLGLKPLPLHIRVYQKANMVLSRRIDSVNR